MLPAVSSILENVLKSQHLFAPLLLVILSALANAHGPAQHSLLITCVSWASIWVPTLFRAGLWSNNASKQRSTSWLAGGFLALAQVCERAACDKEGIWSTKGLLPLFAALISENEALSKHLALPIYTHFEDPTADNSGGVEKRPHQRSYRLLITATASASIVLATRYTTFQTFALGVCSTIFAASGLVLFEAALTGSKDNNEVYTQDVTSTDGTSSRQISWATWKDQHMAALRDVAFVMALVCGIATPLVEPLITSDAVSWAPVYDALRGDWKSHSYQRAVQQILTMISVNVFINAFTFVMIAQEGAVHTTLLVLFSCICARLNLAMSLSGIWFAGIFGLSAVLLSTSSTSTSLLDVRGSMRIRRIFPWFATLSIGLLVFRYASTPGHYLFTHNDSSTLTVSQPDSPFTSIPMDLTKGHPAAQLMGSAEREFDDLLKRQSKSLGEAVQEYRRRNGIAPPPHFDKWYEFASRNGVVLIDEFDTISQSLLPFWALKPATIRARIKNALGFETSETALLAVAIRNGDVVNIEGGHEWQQKATAGMVKGFVQYLPDMDIGFNTHDEPRVVVPINLLSDMLVKAQEEVLPRTAKLQSPRDSFSPRPSDLNDGKNFEEASTSRFNRFTHQQTWTNSRLSCPTNSQAQTFEDYAADNLTAYSAGPLNYIYNRTAFSDICNSPSYSKKFGFFERPNAFSITHELTPIFSQSKISTFQDILYPSPWYWFDKVEYDSDHDTAWENKTNSLYWRGSTTGGFSRNGGWRRQHRQHIVRQINAPNKAKLLVAAGDGENSKYEVQEVQRKDFKHLINVKFSHVGQCDPGDCDAQKEFFEVTERVDRQDAFYHKHILDMDGNAFSGRFYSFLKSKSLTYKMAIFREWHEEWLKPWVHYIPISLIGDEHLDLVRWFGGNAPPMTEKEAKKFDNKGGNGDSLGERKAREIAQRSTEWHDKVLRKVDMEAWFFRLLLEYGRIIDDNREEIGYPGP